MKKLQSLVSLLAAGMILLSGCSQNSDKLAGDGSSGNLKLKVAVQATSGQVFQFLAEDKKFLEREGVDVELVYINAASDAFSALSSGQVDILSTYGTGGPLIQIANGQDFTIFGGYMLIGATPVFARPETKYESIEDFRGKTIAIMRGGTPDLVLKGIMYDAGFDLQKDVTFVEMRRNPDVMEAVRSGQVDFGAVSTGFELQIQEMGMRVVMWPDDLWPDHSCCRMLARSDWLKSNQDAVQCLIRAYLRAEEIMPDNMDRVVELTSKNLDMPVETAKSFLLSPHIYYHVDPYRNSVVKMWEKMQGFGYIVNPGVKIENHIDTSGYKAALDALAKENSENEFYKKKLEEYQRHNF